MSADDVKCKQNIIVKHAARLAVRYRSTLAAHHHKRASHIQLSELSVISSAVRTLVIWHLWEAALGVEHLKRPYGPRCIKKALKYVKLRHRQWRNRSSPLDLCLCEPAKGDYTGVFPPLAPRGQIDLSSSWLQRITLAVKSVTTTKYGTLRNMGQFLDFQGDTACRWLAIAGWQEVWLWIFFHKFLSQCKAEVGLLTTLKISPQLWIC